MTDRPLDPITELSTAVRSPFSLLVGATVGGAAPALNYYTVHWGHLIEGDRVDWRSPLWVLVAGAFALSSKSVYRWGRATFGDPYSAAALVAMLEGALLLSPHPLISKIALGYLVMINATVYGCALALQYQANKAAKAAAAAAAAVVPEALTPVERPLRVLEAPKPVSSNSSSTSKQPILASVDPKPKTVAAPRGDLYERALEAVRSHTSVSAELLRTTLRIRQPTAAELLARLEQEGVLGRPDPADRGRRPVLLSVVPAE